MKPSGQHHLNSTLSSGAAHSYAYTKGVSEFTQLYYEPHEDRVERLRSVVRAVLGQDAQLQFWRAGADYGAYRCFAGSSRYVLRVPHRERTSTSYDGTVDFSEAIRWEVEVHRLATSVGVPCPVVVAFDISHAHVPWPWMLTTLVEHDDAVELPRDQHRVLGEFVRTLHSIQPAAGVIPPTEDWSTFVSERLARRLGGLSRYEPAITERHASQLVTEAEEVSKSDMRHLLHMDLRPANLCVRGGTLVGILDMTNALAGDPLFEIARLDVYGLTTSSFWKGYGAEPRDARKRLLYSLDTTAMLALLAREELADRELYTRMVKATVETARRLL